MYTHSTRIMFALTHVKSCAFNPATGTVTLVLDIPDGTPYPRAGIIAAGGWVRDLYVGVQGDVFTRDRRAVSVRQLEDLRPTISTPPEPR